MIASGTENISGFSFSEKNGNKLSLRPVSHDSETMKRIEVVAAIIRHAGKIFVTQRGYGEFKDYWEFPGGKMEAGESREEALKRELREELDTEIGIDAFLTTIEYNYPSFHITLHFYFCSILSGYPVLKEHENAAWLSPQELDSVRWLPADTEVIRMLQEKLETT